MLYSDPCLRILCVDDDPAMRRILKLALTRSGFEVTTAESGTDALIQYKAHGGNFQAVLSDHDLPNFNGAKLARQLRDIGYQGQIIVMSGRLTISELYEYEPYLISGFFSKPLDIALLAAMLSKCE